MDVTTAPNLWSIAGMLYALSGAGLLWNGFGVMMHHQDASHPVTDVSSKRLAASQIFDGRAGAALIAVGSFLQASGAVSSPHMNKVAVLVLFALIGALLWYLGMKDMVIGSTQTRPPCRQRLNSRIAQPSKPRTGLH